MKFSGKELFEIGVPKKKIKNFINKEFESAEEILELATAKVFTKQDTVYTWVNWLTANVQFLPLGSNGNKTAPMSQSELRRALDSKSVLINGKTFTSEDSCGDEEFPITSLVFFPKGKRKTTYL